MSARGTQGPRTPDRRAVLLGGLVGLAWGAAPTRVLAAPADDDAALAEPVVWRAQVVLVRHAEKQAGDDPELTESGHAAARWLAALLADAPVSYLEHSPFRRTTQTLDPLVAATSFEPVVADPRDVDALRDRLLALPDGALAVIAGHSNTVPQAVAALGGAVTGLDERGYLDESVYDRLFVVSLVRFGEAPVVAQTLELRMP